jgi:hypothetical protein
MSSISGVGSNNYNLDLFLTPPQNIAQSQTVSGSSSTATSATPSINTVQASEQMDIINSVLSQASSSTSASPSLEALSESLSNLELISRDNILQTSPSLAQSVLDNSTSATSLASLAYSSNMLQAAEQSNVLQNNPSLLQSITQGNNNTTNSTGSIINTTA